jgi:hypothetical protein
MGFKMSVGIATQEGQWALDRLVIRFLEYRTAGASDTPDTPGRHHGVHVKVRNSNALIDLVAVAESFTVSRLISIRDVHYSKLTAWNRRKETWRKEADTSLETFSDWDSLMGYVEARNALQHGLGRLTDRQLDQHKDETIRVIDRAGIQRSGPDLIISSRNITDAMEVCRSFISWLDTTAPLS